MKKTMKTLMSIVLVLALCLSLCVAAFAAETENAKVSLTKELKMPSNVTVPDETFTFTFDLVTDEAPTFQADGATISDVTIDFTSADKCYNDVSIVKSSGDIFENATFTHAGAYKFVVKETAGTTEGMTYSGATYTMEVYVENAADGSLIISKVWVKDESGDKVDGTWETKTEIVDGTEGKLNATGNDFRFVNAYEKTVGPNPGDPAALTVSKTVDGNLGNKVDLYFNFTLTLTADVNAPAEGRTYTYKILDAEGNDVTAVAANAADGSITTGVAENFKLKHGEKLAIQTMYAGTKFVVAEAGTANYTGKIVTTNTTNPATITGNANEGVSTQLDTISEDGGATAAFTNTYDAEIPETGISIASLPFIALIVVAMAGLLVILFSKKRREQE